MRTLILAGCVLALTVTHAGAQCLGDFNGDGEVSVSELITAVKNSLSHCQVGNGPRFVENGDGTVSDAQTGLMWEMKDHLDGVEDYANPHDADNKYTWSVARHVSLLQDGTAYTDFLAKLDNGVSTDGTAINGLLCRPLRLATADASGASGNLAGTASVRNRPMHRSSLRPHDLRNLLDVYYGPTRLICMGVSLPRRCSRPRP